MFNSPQGDVHIWQVVSFGLVCICFAFACLFDKATLAADEAEADADAAEAAASRLAAKLREADENWSTLHGVLMDTEAERDAAILKAESFSVALEAAARRIGELALENKALKDEQAVDKEFRARGAVAGRN